MSVLPEYDRYDGLGLADLVRRKEVTAGEVIEEAIARIEVRNPAVNAVVNKMYDHARKVIAAGLPSGPFTGVPYLLKDLGAQYTGVVTAGGSRLFATDVADHDSELTSRLRRAGSVIVGKSSTPEMGLAPSTEPSLFGPTKNPWKPSHSAGGSSGDAARLCASLGHEVEEARPQFDEAKWRQANRMIVAANVAATLDARAALRGRPLAEDDVERLVWERVKDARAFSASDYAGATRVVHLVGRQVARFMERFDVILTPTMCAPPWPLGVLDMMTTDTDRYLADVFHGIGFPALCT